MYTYRPISILDLKLIIPTNEFNNEFKMSSARINWFGCDTPRIFYYAALSIDLTNRLQAHMAYVYHTLRYICLHLYNAQEPTEFRMVVGDSALKRKMNRTGCVHKPMRERKLNEMSSHVKRL